jgi:hypothetical protein
MPLTLLLLHVGGITAAAAAAAGATAVAVTAI